MNDEYNKGYKEGYNTAVRECMNILSKDLGKFREYFKEV